MLLMSWGMPWDVSVPSFSRITGVGWREKVKKLWGQRGGRQKNKNLIMFSWTLDIGPDNQPGPTSGPPLLNICDKWTKQDFWGHNFRISETLIQIFWCFIDQTMTQLKIHSIMSYRSTFIEVLLWYVGDRLVQDLNIWKISFNLTQLQQHSLHVKVTISYI